MDTAPPSPKSTGMPSPLGTGPNRAQRAIDDALIGLERSIRQLKTERNACANISRLPAHILGDIFTFVARSSPLKAWYRINLVCRQWRDTALGTVGLWTNPPTYNHDLALLMVERSKMADLDVEFGKDTPPATTIALLAHIRRIRSLVYIDHTHSLPPFQVFEASSLPSSHLQILSIQFGERSLQPVTSPIPDSLRRLDWKFFPIPNLKHLSLSGVLLPEQITIRHLLLTLREMPNLESVKMHSDIISCRHLPPAPNRAESVLLPALRLLDINCRVEHQHITYLLSHLRLPQLNHLKINFYSYLGEDNISEYSTFLRTISKLVSCGDFGDLGCMATCSDRWFNLTPKDEYGWWDPFSRGVEIWLLEYDGFMHATQMFTFELVAALDDHTISNLVRLELHDTWPTEDGLLQFFSRLQNLEYLAVYQDVVATLTKSLLLSQAHDHSSSGPFQMFPKLTGVALLGFDFWNQSEMINDFIDAIKARHRLGVPILKLYLEQIDLFPKDNPLFSLRELGVELFDEVYGSYPAAEQ